MIQTILDNAGSVTTVVSFVTFIGIVLWTYALKGKGDFDQAARLPFADEEQHHG